MNDPWNEAKRDVEQTLSTASSLFGTVKQKQKQHASADDLSWSQDELNATLSALEADVDELEESISVVEESGAQRFGIDDAELDRRKRFVKSVQSDINRMRRADSATSPRTAKSATYDKPYRDDPDADLEEGDPNEDFERQQQSMIMEQQDQTLSSIAGVIGTLREQAGVIGHEVLDQVGILSNLESDVDQSDSRLARANKRMQDFIKANQNSGSSWCILVLTIVLCILLFVIIIF